MVSTPGIVIVDGIDIVLSFVRVAVGSVIIVDMVDNSVNVSVVGMDSVTVVGRSVDIVRNFVKVV